MKSMASNLKPERARLSLDVQREVHDQIDRIKEIVACGSITEVVRRSLNLYENVIGHMKAGSKIIVHPKRGRDVELLPL